MQRFTFRFVNSEQHKTEDVVIMGHHYDDAKVGAWAVLADLTQDRDPRASWRLVSADQRPAGMCRFAVAMGATLGLLLAVVMPASAQQAVRFNGDETVGEYRGWAEMQRIMYVSGFNSFGALAGLKCQVARSNAEMAAVLMWSSSLKPTDSLPKSLYALLLRDGCQVVHQERQ